MQDDPVGIILSPTKLSGGKIELTTIGDELYDRGEIAAGSLLLVREGSRDTHVILATEIEDKNLVYEERSVYQAVRKSGAEGVIMAEEADLRQVIMEFDVVGEIVGGKNKRLDKPLKPPKPGSKVYQLTKEHRDILFGEQFSRLAKYAENEEALREAISFGTISGSKGLKAIALRPNINMHLGIVGTTGSGKSFTAGAIIEKIAQFKKAYDKKRGMIIFDVHGEYKDIYSNIEDDSLGDFREDYRDEILVLRPKGIDEKEEKGIKYFGIDFAIEEENYLGEKDIVPLFSATEFTEIVKLLYGVKTGAYRNYLERLYDGVEIAEGSETYSLLRRLHEIAKARARGEEIDKAELISEVSEILSSLLEDKPSRGSINAIKRVLGSFLDRLGEMLLYPENEEEEELISPKAIIEKLKEGSLVIVDLTESGKGVLDNTIRDIIISYLLRIIYRSLAKEYRDSDERLVILIDEAQTFIPAKEYDTGAILTKRIVRSIASQGRKFGISLVLISQRPSFMDPHVFSLMNSLIIHRTAMGDAEKLVRTFGFSRNLVNVFSNLRTGEAFLYGILFGNIPMKVRIVKGEDRKMLPSEERGELL